MGVARIFAAGVHFEVWQFRVDGVCGGVKLPPTKMSLFLSGNSTVLYSGAFLMHKAC